MFDSFVFLPLSTRAYFKGRAYIKIILKNHARSYFAGRSYFQGTHGICHTMRTRLSCNAYYDILSCSAYCGILCHTNPTMPTRSYYAYCAIISYSANYDILRLLCHNKATICHTMFIRVPCFTYNAKQSCSAHCGILCLPEVEFSRTALFFESLKFCKSHEKNFKDLFLVLFGEHLRLCPWSWPRAFLSLA